MRLMRFILAASALIAAMVSCSKNGAEESEDILRYEIELIARISDGSARTWTDGDRIHVYHRVSGSDSYTDDGFYTLKDASRGVFTGKVSGGLSSMKDYDWKAVFAGSSGDSASLGTDYLVQDMYGSKNHLKGGFPLEGRQEGVSGSRSPSLSMKEGFTTIEVRVTNKAGYGVPFSTVKVGPTTVFVRNPQEVNVGSSVSIFVPVMPSEADGTVAFSVNGIAGSADIKGEAGETISIGYDYSAHKEDIVNAKVYSGSRYSTFTSMVHFGKKYYVAFRESDTEHCHHSAADMKEKAYIVICSSEDAVRWSRELMIVNEKYDLHDPQLVVAPQGDKVLCYQGTTIPGDGMMRDPATAVSTLVLNESGALEVASTSTVDMGKKSCYWLWGLTTHDGWYYGVGYYYYDEGRPTLFRSKDGIRYVQVSEFEVEGNEASPCFIGNRLYVFFRSIQTMDCFVSCADAPYENWTTRKYGFAMHAPKAVELWGKIYVAMRYNLYSNAICCYDPATEEFRHIHSTFTNTVSTDVGYPGLIIHDGAMHVSWYAAESYLDKSPDIFYQSIGLGKIHDLTLAAF